MRDDGVVVYINGQPATAQQHARRSGQLPGTAALGSMGGPARIDVL